MTQEEVLDKVQEIFRDIFNENTLIITKATSADDIEEWDSFNHINLVSAIEKAFDIRFALGELVELENVGDMVTLMLNEKL